MSGNYVDLLLCLRSIKTLRISTCRSIHHLKEWLCWSHLSIRLCITECCVIIKWVNSFHCSWIWSCIDVLEHGRLLTRLLILLRSSSLEKSLIFKNLKALMDKTQFAQKWFNCFVVSHFYHPICEIIDLKLRHRLKVPAFQLIHHLVEIADFMTFAFELKIFISILDHSLV